MRDLLSGQLHYRVYTDAPEGSQATPQESLESFAWRLPHGSGLDDNWTIEVRPRGRGLMLYTEYHAMDEGSYCGWYPVWVTLNRRPDGALELGSVRINERATNDAGDWIADSINEVLSQEL